MEEGDGVAVNVVVVVGVAAAVRDGVGETGAETVVDGVGVAAALVVGAGELV